LENFCREFGTSTGFLTITFADHVSTAEAHKRFANFKRRVIGDKFGESIKVREFTVRGRPHFHLFIDCKGDITTGFNWAHHKRVQEWNKAGRAGEKPRGTLNRNGHLRRLHRLLLERGKGYRLGRMELTPIRNATAAAFYGGGYLGKSLAHRPADAKGTRSVNYTRNCPRVYGRQWSWNNASGWLWRAKLGKWAAKHGCRNLHEVAGLFGPRWAYHHREQIVKTELDHYPSYEHAFRDGAIDLGGNYPVRETCEASACTGLEVLNNGTAHVMEESTETRGGGTGNSAAPQMETAPSRPARVFVLKPRPPGLQIQKRLGL
jgi:hypothetical protein